MYKFGITERGDAARDLSWVNKMGSVSGAVLITKNIENKEFQKAALHFKDRVIIHATITGLGGTFIEPNVSPWHVTCDALLKFSEIFPAQQLVLRIDPIIPCTDVMTDVNKILQTCAGKIQRVRFSFIDNYEHIRKRGLYLNWDSFNPPTAYQNWFIDYMTSWGSTFDFESCGESNPKINPSWKIGCISNKDYEILNLKIPTIQKLSRQRRECRCLSTKTELLTNRGQCPNGCLYCYWK